MAMQMQMLNHSASPSYLFAGNNHFISHPSSSSQSTQQQQPPTSPSKIHWPQSLLPLTVKQIADSFFDGKSNLVVDGIDANFRVVGMVVDKVERETDVSFLIDDGTGRIEIGKWISMALDAIEVAAAEIGMYVEVIGHTKEFQGKKHAFAFSLRPVTDFNYIALHFIECIYTHLENTRLKGGVPTRILTDRAFGSPFSNGMKGYQAPLSNQGGHPTKFLTNPALGAPFSNGVRGYQAPVSNQPLPHSGIDGSGNDIQIAVLGVFQEPSVLGREHGLHIDEVFRRLELPKNVIMTAINYLVDVGQIYSTIDEYHFKSAISGG